jgi:ATP-dependent helicase YprA (DUF1998 family)
MHPLLALQYIKENFKEFVLSKFPYLPESAEHEQLGAICGQPGEVFQEPVLQLDRPRVRHALKPGEPAFFHPKTRRCLEVGFGTKQGPFLTPYTHQYDAWKRFSEKIPTVVSTGTGSGKSESFIVPLLDLVLKAKEADSGRRKVRAIVVYPMNALLEDQHIRFCRFAHGLGLKVGVYNGSFKELKSPKSHQDEYKTGWKAKIFGEPVDDSVLFGLTEIVDPAQPTTFPDVLLTNYSMLQYMLLRSEDHAILRGAELEALALDEAHLYSGTLGLEMAALIARLREHVEHSGGKTARLVPMATSATLVRGGDERDLIAMSEFFSGLFSTPFPNDSGWLIKDHFEDPRPPQKEVWRGFKLPSHLAEGVLERAKTDVDGAFADLKAAVAPFAHLAEELASQLPWILLRTDEGSFLPVVEFREALRRYAEVREHPAQAIAGSPAMEAEFVCLLSWLSLPKDENNTTSKPLLGLRVHSFTKSEPRIYRELKSATGGASGGTKAGRLLSEAETTRESAPEDASDAHEPMVAIVALPVAHCRNCGHEAYVAFAVDRGDGTFDLQPANRQPSDDDAVFALSLPQSFDVDGLTDGWELQEVSLTRDVGGLQASTVAPKAAKKAKGGGLTRHLDSDASASSPKGLTLWRVARRQSKGSKDGKGAKSSEAPDVSHCPSCLRTSREQLIMKRGSPASDLSVHAQNILAAAEDAKERRLLIFCDNRQDSSFIAGFMSDRHRRLRLRRAVCETLRKNPKGLPLLSANEDNIRPFAATVLENLKAPLGDTSSPGQFKLSTLRAALTADVFDFNSYSSGDFDQWQVDLLEKVNPASSVETASESLETDVPVGFDSNAGRFLLRLFSETILRDLSLGSEKQGALRSLGLVAAWHSALRRPDIPAPSLAIQLFFDLYEAQAWNEKPKGLEGQRRQFAKECLLSGLAHDLASRRTLVGKAFRENEPDAARALELVDGGKAQEGDKEKVLAWLKDTVKAYADAGLVKTSVLKKDILLELMFENIELTADVSLFRSAVKCQERPVPVGVSLQSLHTGKHPNDYFDGPMAPRVAKAWTTVYLGEMNENTDPFVRAHEHNGMLKPVQAMRAIQKFGTLEFNTLVATPTLEMGIDLPDLPVVAHRSVPPDPSNYAQRAGRAGRDKRRALLLTHCGRGAHDSGYFQEPTAMVSGQIAPPGVPRENTWLLKRHVNAIVLQHLASRGLNLRDWDALIDRKSYFDVMYENDTTKKMRKRETSAEKQNWRRLLEDTTGDAEKAASAFSAFLEKGLWAQSALHELTDGAKSHAELRRELNEALKNFPQRFQETIDAYEELLNVRVRKLDRIKKEMAERDSYGLRRRLVAELHSNLTTLLPIPFLQGAGFLPNFDFPMDAVRFSGYKRNTIRSKSKAPEVTVDYSRALTSAMREFAPGQRHYAAGHVFTIDRYTVVGQNKEKSLSQYGVCSAGCSSLTRLTELTRNCTECGEPLIGSTEANTKSLPPILRLSAVQGKTAEFIGDRSDEKDSAKLTSESLVVGDSHAVPSSWRHGTYPGLALSLYESSLGEYFGLDIMTVVGAKPFGKETESKRALAPLYRNSPDQDDFTVKAFADKLEGLTGSEDNDVEGLCIHPFLLGQKFNADALKLEVKVSELPIAGSDDSALELPFFETLRAVLVKAIRRELFLSARSSQLSSFVFKKVVRMGGENRTYASALCLYDAVPGGSGIMPLLRSYWPRILQRAKSIVLSEAAPFNCCAKACKRCISTYENQSVDALLDKRHLIFRDATQTKCISTLFDVLGGVFEHANEGSAWLYEKARLTSVDPDEPDFSAAERAFRAFLLERLPSLEYLEQSSLRNDTDNEVTRPDFVLRNGDSTFHVFVDGYKYHGKASQFFGDLRKRNFVEFRSLGTTLSIPASRVVGKAARFEELQEKILAAFGGASKTPEFEFERRGRFDPNLPEYDMPQYDEYNVLFDEAWKKPIQNGLLSGLRTLKVEGYREATAQAVCVIDPPILESGFVEKSWWHLFWTEILELQIHGVRPVVLVTSSAKAKA